MATILIAEDDVQILRVLSMWFGRNGHNVIECRDGQEALDRLDDSGADVIVSDVNMPRVDGLELVRTIREERKSAIPMVVLSSRCDQSSIAADLAVHGIRVHPKPFSPSRLLAELEAMLAGTGRRDDADPREADGAGAPIDPVAPGALAERGGA